MEGQKKDRKRASNERKYKWTYKNEVRETYINIDTKKVRDWNRERDRAHRK